MAVLKSFLLLLPPFQKRKKTQTIQLFAREVKTIDQLEHHIPFTKSFRHTKMSMWINDGSLAKQSYARAFAWSNESTFQKRGYIQYLYCGALFMKDPSRKD
jgi:hypothetical protein